MIRKFLCLIGYHEFKWKLGDGLCLTGSPPDNAKCKYCGITYGITRK